MAKSVSWQGVCTACGKKQNMTSGSDPNKVVGSYSAAIPGKCPNTKNGKHVAMWIQK